MDGIALVREHVLLAASDAERQRALVALAESLYEYDAAEAIAAADEAITLAMRLDDADGEAWAMHHRGWALASMGRTSEALSDQLAAYEHFETTDDMIGIGNVLMAIGDLYADAGDTTTALDYFERARGPIDGAGDVHGRGVLLNLTGISLSRAGRHRDAERLFSEARGIFASLDDPVRVAMVTVNRGFELVALADEADQDAAALVAAADAVAADVITRGTGLGDNGRNTLAYGRSLRSQVLSRQGRLDEALGEAQRAQDIAAAAGFDTLALEIAFDRIEWQLTSGRTEQAWSLLEWARLRSRQIGNKWFLARAASLRADLMSAAGDAAAALEAYREFHDLDRMVHTDAAEQRVMLATERLHAEQMQRDAELARMRVDELVRLDHTKRDFLASVSHELRTPLAAVLGFATELTENWSRFEGTEARSLVEVIARQAADISSIVEDLLTLTRLEAGAMTVHPSPVEIAEHLEPLVSALAREWLRPIAWSGDAEAIADPLRLRQVMRNLVTNAFRYGGSDVGVEVRVAGALVEIDVSDSGGPIPDERVVTMFDPFDHEEGDGRRPNSVGLGLAVARSLARLMDGDLSYVYEGGRSIFRLALSAADQ